MKKAFALQLTLLTTKALISGGPEKLTLKVPNYSPENLIKASTGASSKTYQQEPLEQICEQKQAPTPSAPDQEIFKQLFQSLQAKDYAAAQTTLNTLTYLWTMPHIEGNPLHKITLCFASEAIACRMICYLLACNNFNYDHLYEENGTNQTPADLARYLNRHILAALLDTIGSQSKQYCASLFETIDALIF